MLSMKREVKIGLFAVVILLAAWAGVRFLKGFDIFGRNAVYYAAYDQVNGVQSASPVMMKGVKIGTVTKLTFNPNRSNKVILQLTVKRQYNIPSDSEAKIFSNGLLGNKAIEIIYGKASTYLESGDTLHATRDPDLMDVAGSEFDFFKQKVADVTTELSRALENLNHLIEDNAQNINGTLGHLNSMSGDMAGIVRSERENLKDAVEGLTKFSSMLGNNTNRVDSIIGNVNALTTQLSEKQFAEKLTQAVDELDALLKKIESGDGTMGRLVSDPQLYNSLNDATAKLTALLSDVKQYPGRYVSLSVFGRDPDKAQARAVKRAAKEAAKAQRDSVRRTR